MAEEPGQRQRKRALTREALIRAAFMLFRDQGYEATTVDEIAALGGVSRRTFFRYFPSKEAVAFPHRETRLAHFEALIDRPLPGEAPYETVRRALLTTAEDFIDQRETLLAQRAIFTGEHALIAYERRIDRDWEDLIAATLCGDRRPRRSGAAAPSPEERLHAQLLAGAMMGVIRALLRRWIDTGAREDLTMLGRRALDLFERGLTPKR